MHNRAAEGSRVFGCHIYTEPVVMHPADGSHSYSQASTDSALFRCRDNADSALSVNGWFAGRWSTKRPALCVFSVAGPSARELWFAAHGRALPEEMTTLSQDLQDAVHRTERPAPALDALLSPAPIGRTPCGACGHDRRGCR